MLLKLNIDHIKMSFGMKKKQKNYFKYFRRYEAFRRYARSYKVGIIDTKDPLAQLETG